MLATLALPAPALADTLIDNANGIQVDAHGKLMRFTGVLVGDDGKVVKLFAQGEARPATGARIDVAGKTLLPGLIDAHGHVMDLGFMALQLDLSETQSLADLQGRLKAYAHAHPGAKWILGRGWNQEMWPDKRFPTVADLDAVVSDRPVWLERIDGHAAVANSAAMKAAGITAETKAPSGGRIDNGLFVDNARQLVAKAVPPPTAGESDEALAKAQDILLGNGITTTANMRTPIDEWNTFRRAGDTARLRMRLLAYAYSPEPLKTITKPTSWLNQDRLRLVGVKFYTDGALGSRGAWLKRPYADQPDTRGLQFHSDAELLGLVDQAASLGFQIATHAIGDAANAQVISIYEQLARKYSGDRRWRIEHAQVVDPADIPRIGRAHIIASMQPTHQVSDRLMAENRLGPSRLAGAYAWQSILKSVGRLAFGSDFPFDRPNPFLGLSAAISRQDAEGQPPRGWLPQERVSLEQALQAYTRGAAFAGFAEDRLGSLDPGHWADFILVDRDISTASPTELAATRVLETWVAGKIVWQQPASAPAERGK